jgi:HEPN domain-containing protein
MAAPPEPRAEPGSALHWLLHAKSGLRAGTVLKADELVLSEKACFHFQQAAEKALKGVLVARKIDFAFTHDIGLLLNTLIAAKVRLPRPVRRADMLTPYAVQTRYPADLPEIPDTEVAEAEEVARTDVTWAEARIVAKKPRRRPSIKKTPSRP